LDIKHTGISKSDIKQLKDLGFSVNIWTVNDPELAKTFAGYGVDFITTNILE
jgi:glycerophosphoryl diester phosphodiesterase